MRILLIHQYFKESDVTGGARFNEMARVWKDMGHDITVIAGDMDAQAAEKRAEYKGNFVSKNMQEGIEVWRCNVSESYNKNFLGRLWGYFSFVFSGTYAGLFQVKGEYDVILVTSPPLFVGIIAYLISVSKRIPFVFEVRDLWPESAIDTGVLRNKRLIKFAYWFEGFIYKKASLINVLTPAFYRKLKDEKDIPEDKLIMIPNASDFNMSDDLMVSFDRQSFRKERGWNDKFVVTYVGAHGLANGLHQILEAADKLRDTSILFVLVGTGMKKKDLIAEAETKDLNNVQFFDPVPKREVLKFVMASEMGASVLLKNDTFKTVYSNKTFDYMSCKRPILLAIDGVSREMIEEAQAGVYVEPENPAELESKLRYCLEHKDELLRMGENGYTYAKENFDREILAKEYIDHINRVDNNKRNNL